MFGGVHKLAAVEGWRPVSSPKIKISETAEKTTIPHLKTCTASTTTTTGKAMADYITMADETVDVTDGITLFRTRWRLGKSAPLPTCAPNGWNRPIYVNGKRVYENPPLRDIRISCAAQVATLWDEVTRFENPHRYYVDLSQKLWDERQRLLTELAAERGIQRRKHKENHGKTAKFYGHAGAAAPLLALHGPRYKGILCFDLFCAALTSVCELVLPLIMRSITNMGVNDLSSLTVSYILRVGALYLVLRLIDGAANYFMANTGHVMGARIETDMRRDAF